MAIGGIVAFGLFVAGAALGLAQLWFRPWDDFTFFKLLATDGVLFVVVLVAAFLFRERRATERLANKRELD